MSTSNEMKEDYERRFYFYIMKYIKYNYLNYLEKIRKESEHKSLNETTENGTELINLVIGDEDILYEENITPENLENLTYNENIHKAIKALSNREKMVIYLYFVKQLNGREIAELLKLKRKGTIYEILKRALNKIRKKIDVRVEC